MVAIYVTNYILYIIIHLFKKIVSLIEEIHIYTIVILTTNYHDIVTQYMQHTINTFTYLFENNFTKPS